LVELFEGDIYRDLKERGFTEQEIQQVINPNYTTNQNYQPANTIFSPSVDNNNLVQFQLELNDILERIEHILRGDKLTFSEGREIWIRCEENEKRLFNDEGVAEIMGIITMEINRNTILSNFDEKTIRNTVFDLGVRLNDLIFMKYEKFGLDNPDKRKNYSMVLGNIIDMVRATYYRALEGGERLSLREARSVTQNEVINPYETINLKNKRRSVFDVFGGR